MLTETDYLQHLLTSGQITLEDYMEQFEQYIVYDKNMKVTELGDCTVVIGKEDNDKSDFTIGSMFEGKENPKVSLFFLGEDFQIYHAKDYIFNDKALIIYLDSIPEKVEVGSCVGIKVGKSFYQTIDDRTIDLCYLG